MFDLLRKDVMPLIFKRNAFDDYDALSGPIGIIEYRTNEKTGETEYAPPTPKWNAEAARQLASSRERFVAAAIASSIRRGSPSSAMRTCKAAWVVPFGEVTFLGDDVAKVGTHNRAADVARRGLRQSLVQAFEPL